MQHIILKLPNFICILRPFLNPYLTACTGDTGVSGTRGGENIYLPDGVQLNDLGNLKLFRSIRGAVIKAVGLVGLKFHNFMNAKMHNSVVCEK